MALTTFGGTPKIRAQPVPPQDAVATGEVFKNDRGDTYIVYRQKVYNPHARLEPVLDENGEQVYRHDPGKPNGRGKPLMRRIDGLIEREYILVPDINANVKRNFNFRPDPEDVARRARRELREKVLDELIDRRVDQLMAEQAGEPDLALLSNAELVKMCVERGIDADAIQGTGSAGRLVKADLIAALNAQPPPAEDLDGSDTY